MDITKCTGQVGDGEIGGSLRVRRWTSDGFGVYGRSLKARKHLSAYRVVCDALEYLVGFCLYPHEHRGALGEDQPRACIRCMSPSASRCAANSPGRATLRGSTTADVGMLQSSFKA